jgi:hypothetical protein
MMNRCSPLIRVLLLGAIAIVNTPCLNASPSHELAMGIHTIRANDHLLQLAEDGGFTWLIQLLEWREVEPVPGEYFWEYPDWLVRAAEYYGLDLILRLDHPAEWALPVDVAAYAAFVQQVAARYQGRVTAYVIWNEPNLAAEWGGRPPDAAEYVELLCAAHSAVRAADPQALVISAGLAPTNHMDDSGLDDRLYLQAMYDAGAAACFDVLGAHPYGFAYPPTDPHGDHDGLNFARLVELRAIMVENGDEDRPVWATELGWATAPVGAEGQWLQVSEDEQSRYLAGAVAQAKHDWPWLERIAVWNMSAGLPEGDERRGYSILTKDGTPKLAYEALTEMLGERGVERVEKRDDGRPAEILAPDVVIRLSDVGTSYPHWARPHCKSIPCRRWNGQFYVNEPGDTPWQLHIEIMQVEELGNLVWINEQLLDPANIPLRGRPDFASVWTSVEMVVPPDLLRSGVNSIEIGCSPRLPAYQNGRARFESLQFRNLYLLKVH